jgi:hypothetical protein
MEQFLIDLNLTAPLRELESRQATWSLRLMDCRSVAGAISQQQFQNLHREQLCILRPGATAI